MSKSLKQKIETLSFCQANSPVYFISKLLGQAPYGITEGSSKNISQMKFTIPNLVYSLLCYGFYCVTLYFFIIDILTHSSNFPGISLIGHFMHIVIGFITSNLCFTFSLIKARNLSAFINELFRIDDELFDLCERVRIDYQKSFIFQLKLFIAIALLFCFVGGFDYFVFYGLYGNMSIIVVISYIIPYMFIICTAGQFIVGVHLIYERFILINKFLNNVADTNEPTSVAVKMHRALFDDCDKNKAKVNAGGGNEPFTISRNLIQRKHETLGGNSMEINRMFDVKTKLDKDKIDSISFPSANNKNRDMERFNHFITTSTTTSDSGKHRTEKLNSHDDGNAQSFSDFFKTIFKCNAAKVGNKTEINGKIELDYPLNLHLRMNEIFSIHDKLSDIAEIFNDLYSIEMVIFITGGFVMTLFGIFVETKVIFWGPGINLQLLFFATSYILWGVFVSVIIYAILRFCSKTREESCESALIIHKILQNKPAFMLNDETFYGKMKSFTLQILHRKKVFNFHGLGLFKLDYTFIFSAVSAATSYLIVLLQFDMTSDFQNFITKTNTTTTV